MEVRVNVSVLIAGLSLAKRMETRAFDHLEAAVGEKQPPASPLRKHALHLLATAVERSERQRSETPVAVAPTVVEVLTLGVVPLATCWQTAEMLDANDLHRRQVSVAESVGLKCRVVSVAQVAKCLVKALHPETVLASSRPRSIRIQAHPLWISTNNELLPPGFQPLSKACRQAEVQPREQLQPAPPEPPRGWHSWQQ